MDIAVVCETLGMSEAELLDTSADVIDWRLKYRELRGKYEARMMESLKRQQGR